MNYFKIILAISGMAAFVSPAPYPGGDDQKPVFKFAEEHCNTMCDIVQGGDDPEALVRLLDGATPAFDIRLYAPLEMMIASGRNRSFGFLFPLFKFPSEYLWNAATTVLLKIALFYGNLEAAELLLRQRQRPIGHIAGLWWHVYTGRAHEPWDLESLKALISRNPEHASDMAPTATDIEYARDAKDGLLLIELAIHCDAENAKSGIPATFDASRFLAKAVFPGCLADADMAQVIKRLFELGAEVTPKLHATLDVRAGNYEQSKQVLRECEMALECERNGKVTEEEAMLFDLQLK